MNDQLGSARSAHASAAQPKEHDVDTELVESSRPDVCPAQTLPPSSSQELATRFRLRTSPLRDHKPRFVDGQANEFLTVFSHELRNSLGAIRSAIQIQSMDTTARPSTMNARVLIERQVAQMTRLVEDLLDVSRVRSGHLRLQCERTNLCAVVAHAMDAVEFTMRQHNHRVTTLFPPAPVWLEADASRLEQVFVNLLLNAAKYTEAGGEVGVTVEQEAREATVRIHDTGIGIASDVLPHVFDLFVQADPSARCADAGLGIGLALVRSLVECHGGRVTVASAGLRRGTEFTVRLPMPAK
jgi:signal transduction histidine kinase